MKRIKNSIDSSPEFYNQFAEKEYDERSEHPCAEVLLLREALKYLTPTQMEVWELWNYDKLTQDQIAKKLSISQQGVSKHLRAIEQRVKKFVKGNMGTYKLLKRDYGNV
jgi:RNA polymerase sigma factor (sigma-70 family)